MRFKDKVVLITGGSRGIGKATTEAFAREGASVAINFRNNREAAELLVESLEGGIHSLHMADISDPGAVSKMVQDVLDFHGKLDILVNNAGIHEVHPIDQVSYEKWQVEWSKTLATNLIGAANMMFCCAQVMIRQKSGRIVNVSSRGAFRGEPDQPAYGASKAGLNALSQSLAIKLAKYNISVSVVAPCFTETEMVEDILNSPKGESIKHQSPLKRVAKPQEVAHAILFLSEEKSLYLTGAIVDVNGASYLRS